MVSQRLDIELFNSDYLKSDQALVSHSADEDLKGESQSIKFKLKNDLVCQCIELKPKDNLVSQNIYTIYLTQTQGLPGESY